MRYIDFHCDTITELHDHPAAGTLRESSLYIDIHKLRKGGCFIQDFALWVDSGVSKDPWARYEELLSTFRKEMAENRCLMTPILNREDIRDAEADGKIGALLSIEGGEVVGGSIEKLHQV